MEKSNHPTTPGNATTASGNGTTVLGNKKTAPVDCPNTSRNCPVTRCDRPGIPCNCITVSCNRSAPGATARVFDAIDREPRAIASRSRRTAGHVGELHGHVGQLRGVVGGATSGWGSCSRWLAVEPDAKLIRRCGGKMHPHRLVWFVFQLKSYTLAQALQASGDDDCWAESNQEKRFLLVQMALESQGAYVLFRYNQIMKEISMKNTIIGLRPVMILALSVVTLVGCATYDHRDLKGLGSDVTEAESRLGSAVFVYEECPIKDKAETSIRDGLKSAETQESVKIEIGEIGLEMATILPAVLPAIAAVGSEFAIKAISKGLEERKKGLMGEFIANGVTNGDSGDATGCLVVTRGLFGAPPNEGKGQFSKEWLKKLGLADHPAFYWEAEIKKEGDTITLKPVYLNYAASSARNCGSGEKNVSVLVAMSRTKSAPIKDGEIQEDKTFAVFPHNLGRLKIGKYYKDETKDEENGIFTGTSYSQTSEEFSKREPFNITVKVTESEDPSIALEALTEAFTAKKSDLQKVLKDLVGGQ